MSALIRSQAELVPALTRDERSDLKRLESIVRGGLNGFVEVGRALVEIHEKRLYRDSHSTFRDYIQDTWGRSESWLWQMIGASEVVENLAEAGLPSPSSERQIRPLVSLAPDTQREAWKTATDAKPKPTSKDVAEAVERVAPKRLRASDKLDKQVEAAKDAGIIPRDAEVAIDEGDPTDSTVAESTKPPELTDAEWLETLPARSALSELVRARFDTEALAFREITPHRLKFAATVKPITNKARKAAKHHIGPYIGKLSWFLRLNDPSRWKSCVPCKGTGREPLLGECGACKGQGYTVQGE